MAELKPCPFCGGDAELDTRQGYAQFPPNGKHGTRVTVYCRDCGADLGVCREDVPSIEAEQVTGMWNRRAPAAEMGDLAALVRQLVRALRKAAPGHALADRAADYLKRKGLEGSPLRDGVEAPVPNDPDCACGSDSPRAFNHALSCPHSTPWNERVKARIAAGGTAIPEEERDHG